MLNKAVAAQKEKSQVIERMDLEKTQTEKAMEALSVEVENLKRDNTRLTKQRNQEKKECEAKTFECDTFKSDSETCKTKFRDVKNELERLKLEHDQIRAARKQKEEDYETLKAQLEERDVAAQKLLKKVETEGLEKLLDPTMSETTSKIEKNDIESLLPDKPAHIDTATQALSQSGVNATAAPSPNPV